MKLFDRVHKVVIAGVGLIGGSIGLALKRAGFPGKIVGLGRRRCTLDDALRVGAVDVVTLDYVTFEELRDSYSRAKVYAQFSVREGLPSVVCEAMLCECIPVGTNNNGIPTAIGDFGFIMEGRTPQEAAKLIKLAMDSPDQLGKQARQRISSTFTRERRKESLFQLLDRY